MEPRRGGIKHALSFRISDIKVVIILIEQERSINLSIISAKGAHGKIDVVVFLVVLSVFVVLHLRAQRTLLRVLFTFGLQALPLPLHQYRQQTP